MFDIHIAKVCTAGSPDEYAKLAAQIAELSEKLDMKKSELAAQLTALTEQNNRNNQEIADKLAAMQQAIDDAGESLPEDLVNAFNDLKTSIQAGDDLVVPG